MSEKKEVKPFFTKFLEGMDKKEMKEAKGGMTLKFPSDSDEEWPWP
jgi:hypothetical protein